MRTDAEYARELDRGDELAAFRDAFVVEDPRLIYLDGNSLGRLPRATVERLRGAVEREWGGRLIRGWGDGWMEAPRRIGGKIARLVGAEPDEVLVADSTSVNLFKLVVGALRLRPGRTRIVTDDLNFPSDVYVLQGALRLAGPGYRLEIVRSPDGCTLPVEALAAAIDDRTALVALTHAVFRSSFVHDVRAVTELAHRAGALALWDVSHSVGALPIELGAARADLAVGCTYKYLNGGPGSPAFLYVRRELQEDMLSPIWGWLGQRAPFEFGLDYAPGPGIQRFLAGTPPVLSLLAIEPGVDLVLEAGIERLRAKSVRQSEYLIELWGSLLAPLGFTLNSPREAARRGSHVSLGHREGLRIDRALIEEMGVLPDFRYPDNIRLGIAPLYTSYADIHAAVSRLSTVVEDRLYEKYPDERPAVT
ncbi:MAG: kynureninase [Candidatus Rokuibacteriota bacterium]